ncbi:MAG: sodium:alanine symporter family protein [Phycisphaerales bacterium]|nr:MAG: sodium:alanine symporter family protein [Phycisphaerales bacterium]
METIADWLDTFSGILFHEAVVIVVVLTGLLFTFWSFFSQYRALTHGFSVIRGKWDEKDDPGAINHFQALSAALSATVGLGNIAGVAVAVALGGPGAIFWMWIIGIVGMALKTTEVTLSMLYRNTDEADNPHGGPMWVAKEGFKKMGLGPLGSAVGGIFCVTVIISAITGGNMFQSWNVGDVTNTYFGIPPIACGIILAIIVGMVIIGGIKRIGAVAGRLVPVMCVLYLLAAVYVLFMNLGDVPRLLWMIVQAGLPEFLGGTSLNPEGAFLGATFGYAAMWGIKRALFSSEAGQGSAPIAHSAAKTKEPVREGVVAGMEPFIDTLVVCTLTALVIMSSGAWNRPAEAEYKELPELINAQRLVTTEMTRHWVFFEREGEVERFGIVLDETDDEIVFLDGNAGQREETHLTIPRDTIVTLEVAEDQWMPNTFELPRKLIAEREISGEWRRGDNAFMLVEAGLNTDTGKHVHRMYGSVRQFNDELLVVWSPFESDDEPELRDQGIYGHYAGAALTAHAFDRVTPGLGMWLVVLASWLFAISTMITWSYYGEQGVVYLSSRLPRSRQDNVVLLYKLLYCLLIAVATLGFITTDEQLDLWTTIGLGVMLWANIPIMLIFGYQAMRAYHDYMRRLKSGEMQPPHEAPPITDVVEGKDVE